MTSTDTSVSRPPRLSWVVAACLAFATFLAYANSFRGVFVMDDIADILQNPALRSLQTPVAAIALFDLALVTLTSPRVRGRFNSLAAPLSAGIALLWAVHPLQTQKVWR